jgi:BirA family biotin operon repressor/biotin-[acetyl-CoA-carboxylase] ligase
MNEPVITEGAGLWGGRLLTFASLPSTNQWALDNAALCRNGDVVRAVSQTAGRGRFDRTWLSPAGRCLTISAVIGCDVLNDFLLSAMSRIGALAVREVLAGHALPAMVKWPNDVMLRGRKIAGILAERRGREDALVVGIGLNVNMSQEDLCGTPLPYPATSMAEQSGRAFDVAVLCAALVRQLERTIDLAQEGRQTFLLQAWEPHDYLTGRDIRVSTPDSGVYGRYAGISANGELRLVEADGRERRFLSGDVSLTQAPPGGGGQGCVPHVAPL